MNLYGHMRIAEDMELPKGFVVQAQKRYLREKLISLNAEIEDHLDWVDGVLDINEHFALIQLTRLCGEVAKTKQELHRAINFLKPSKGSITDEMIERAKEYPVDKLIDFTGGLTQCFVHEDRNPSMFHATRGNFSRCPVCDQNFNPIDVLIFRDGMSFIDAVKQLQ